MSSLLNKRLDSVEWGEFRLGDLFDVGTGSLLSTSELENGNLPRISAKADNNGVIGYFDTVKSEKARHFQNFISINFFGTDGGVFHHPYKASVEMKVHTLKISGVEFSARTGAFITSALKPLFHDFGYGNQLSSSKLRELDFNIKLPSKNGKIDFDFMESFIAELEAERIAELEAYLSATGLKDYNLTPEEQAALSDYEKLKFKDVNVVEVFNVQNSDNILSRDIIENSGEVPYLSASSVNNGVSSYISYDEKHLDKGNCIFIGGKTFVVTYQEKDFYSNDSHNLMLYLKDEGKRNKLTQLYLATCVNKSLGYKYSWSDSISNRKIQKDIVSIPTKKNQPDYKAMETLISAVQKVVIKGVVEYADKKIVAHNKVIGAC